MRCFPAVFDSPAGCYHVVGAVGMAEFFRGAGGWDMARVGGEGCFDGGGVEVGHCQSIGIVRVNCVSIEAVKSEK